MSREDPHDNNRAIDESTPSKCRCIAFCRDGGWREALWTRVFGEPVVPISHPYPVSANLAGERHPALFLDKSRVTPSQIRLLSGAIVKHFSLSQTEALAEMANAPIPIKVDETISVQVCFQHQTASEPA